MGFNLKRGREVNKRQIKKRKKIISERIIFFNQHFVSISRRNGKTYLSRDIYKACISKKYKYFKELKKIYKGVFIAIDWSNGKDYSVKTTYIKKDGVVRVLKNEIIN